MVEGSSDIVKIYVIHCRAGENKCGEQKNLRKRPKDVQYDETFFFPERNGTEMHFY